MSYFGERVVGGYFGFIWGGPTLREQPVMFSSGVVGGCFACDIYKGYRVVDHAGLHLFSVCFSYFLCG